MKKKILIYGAYGEGNIGDDLLLDIIIQWIESKSDSQIFIAATNKEYLKNLYPEHKIISKIEARFITKHLFILGGGTQFFSFNRKQHNKKSNKYMIAGKYFFSQPLVILRILRFYLSKGYNNQKIAIGLGLGPFEGEDSDLVVSKELFDFKMIYSRDVFSYEICKKFNIPSKLGADICFSRYFRSSYPFAHKKSNDRKSKVGVILRDWSQNDIGEIINSKMLDWINENQGKYNISIFVFSSIKDSALIKMLKKATAVPVVAWSPDVDNANDYLKYLSGMDLLITTRFHAAVFGANFNIPTICLGIDPKLFYLAEEIEGFFYFEYTFEHESIENVITTIFNQYEEIQALVQKSRQQLQDKADDLFLDAEKYL